MTCTLPLMVTRSCNADALGSVQCHAHLSAASLNGTRCATDEALLSQAEASAHLLQPAQLTQDGDNGPPRLVLFEHAGQPPLSVCEPGPALDLGSALKHHMNQAATVSEQTTATTGRQSAAGTDMYQLSEVQAGTHSHVNQEHLRSCSLRCRQLCIRTSACQQLGQRSCKREGVL